MDKILQIIALVKMYGPVVVEIVLALHHNGEEVWPGGGGDCACAG